MSHHDFLFTPFLSGKNIGTVTVCCWQRKQFLWELKLVQRRFQTFLTATSFISIFSIIFKSLGIKNIRSLLFMLFSNIFRYFVCKVSSHIVSYRLTLDLKMLEERSRWKYHHLDTTFTFTDTAYRK